MDRATGLKIMPKRRGRRMLDGKTLGEVAEEFLFNVPCGADTTRMQNYISDYYDRPFSRASIRAVLGKLKSEGKIMKIETEWFFIPGKDIEKSKITLTTLPLNGIGWHKVKKHKL